MTLRVMFVDMNSFFASAEQHLQPALRGKPIVVAAVDVDTTCCIAVSTEAKRLGVKRGMPIWQVRKMGNVKVVEARPAQYVKIHRAIVSAVDSCLPVSSIDSIDELSCRLDPTEAEPAPAIAAAQQVKRAIREQVGGCLTCSIGLAPNRFLAKVASNFQKPNGLTVLDHKDLPHRLHVLQLIDLPGIGPRMLRRINQSGIATVEQLCRLTEPEMKKLWNGIVGQRWWHWLRGNDLSLPPTHRSTVGHSHVLPPHLRNTEGSRMVLLQLIHKAAARLRQLNYWARRMDVDVSYSFREERWSATASLGLCQDTLTMIEAFHQLWRDRPPHPLPTQVAVTLHHLCPAEAISNALFPEDRQRQSLAKIMDELNLKFGSNTVYFGCISGVLETAPTRIAFTQIPDFPDE